MSRPNEQFFEAYLAGTLSGDDKIALAEKLDSEPAWREAFLSYIEEAHDIGVVAGEQRNRKRFRHEVHPLSKLAAAAAVALTAGSLFMLVPRDPEQPAAPDIVGRVISGSLHVTDRAEPVAVGGSVPVGVASARGETVMIKFDSGSAVALFEGTEVELIDPSTLRLRQGRLTGRTGGKAQELTVIAAEMRVTDLGTRFGVEQNSTGAIEVHVLDGTVKISESVAAERVITENEALRYISGSPPQSIPVDWRRFEVRFPDLDAEGPAFVHYGFEDTSQGRFTDSGSGFDGGPFPLSRRDMGGRPRSSPGRFGLGLVLASGDALSSDFPGIAGDQARTVAFWVKPGVMNRTMAVVSWGQIGQGRKWQIGLHYDHQSMRLLPRTEFGEGWVVGDRNITDGVWHHLASVYTGGNDRPSEQLVHHYIDGEPVPIQSYQPQAIDTKVNSSRSVDLLVGYHQDRPSDFYFSGQLDELYIFDRALSPVEIRHLHQHNSPPPATSR